MSDIGSTERCTLYMCNGQFSPPCHNNVASVFVTQLFPRPADMPGVLYSRTVTVQNSVTCTVRWIVLYITLCFVLYIVFCTVRYSEVESCTCPSTANGLSHLLCLQFRNWTVQQVQVEYSTELNCAELYSKIQWSRAQPWPPIVTAPITCAWPLFFSCKVIRVVTWDGD